MLFGPPAPIITVPMLQKVSYTANSFTPLNIFASYPFLLGVKASLPAKNTAELIAYAKKDPGKLNYSSAGFGAISHLVAALFAAKAEIQIVHVPYKGAAPATAALLTGEVGSVLRRYVRAHTAHVRRNNSRPRDIRCQQTSEFTGYSSGRRYAHRLRTGHVEWIRWPTRDSAGYCGPVCRCHPPSSKIFFHRDAAEKSWNLSGVIDPCRIREGH